MKDSFLELEMDSLHSYPLAEDEKISLRGHFCLRRIWPNNKCFLLSPEDLSKYEVKFYYPDITQEVTEQVLIAVKEDRHEFSFNPLSLKKSLRPEFIVQVVNKGSKSEQHQRALLKIKSLAERMLSKKSQIPGKAKKSVDRFLAMLKKIETRLKLKAEEDTALIAFRSFPLQIENIVSKPSSWKNAAEEWEIALNLGLGNSFDGEKSWIDLELRPYSPTDEQWKVEVTSGNSIIEKFEINPTSSIFKKRLISPYLTSGINSLSLKLFRKEASPSGKIKWNRVFEKEYLFSTFQDDQIPQWNTVAETIYTNEEVISLLNSAWDTLGRLDQESLKLNLLLEDGTTLNILSQSSLIESGAVLIPERHGDQKGSSEISFSSSLSSIPEGIHVLNAHIKDFAGNVASYSQELRVDRTPPSIFINQLPAITNQEIQELRLSISDASPLETTIYLNGLSINTFSEANSDFPITLNEGVNLISVKSTDAAGNTTQLSLPPVILDTIAPTLININIANGEIIRALQYNLNGTADETLSGVKINGTGVNLGENKKYFEYNLQHLVEGDQKLTIELSDIAGNVSTSIIDYKFILRILDKNLITIEPSESSQGLWVTGLPGAAKPGILIEVSAGLFNKEEVYANEDGSFQVELEFFKNAQVEAYDEELDRTETVDLVFNVDTTFAGIVKDINDNPLPGVTVMIASTGQSTVTDPKGIFNIPNPALGDQHIVINGSNIPVEVTQGKKVFGQLSLNVNLGNRQNNVLERPIYLAPKLLDGTEVEVLADQNTVVETPHAPGLQLVIPAGVATFPGGGKTGTINAIEIPSSRTSIEILEEAEPDTVYALEPSGLKFSQRVDLTLPNVNEFPVGTELVILSKNSSTGLWEIDGSANVTSADKIETKPGQGISHFSEIYAAPLGMELKQLGLGDRPSIDTKSGSVKSMIQLPSFKTLGENITPTLVYDSSWAHPTSVITNVFDMPRKYVEMSASVGASSIFGSVKVKGTIQQWIFPEYIDSQFFAGDFESEKIRFNGVPDKSVVSYQMDLGSIPSGVFPVESTYEIRFRKLTLRTIKIKKKRLFKRRKTTTKTYWESVLLDAVFPPSLVTNVYHQNKKNSEVGSGWRVGLAKKILNPEQDRIMIETEDGRVSSYTLKNSIENVVYDESGITSFNLGTNNSLKYTNPNSLLEFDTGSKTIVNNTEIKNYKGSLGVNYSRTQHGTVEGTTWGYLLALRWYCLSGRYEVNIPKNVKDIIPKFYGSIILDSLGRVSNIVGNSEQDLIGKNKLINTFTSVDRYHLTLSDPRTFYNGPQTSQYCLTETGKPCSTFTRTSEYITELVHPLDGGEYSANCNLSNLPEKVCSGYSISCNYTYNTSHGNWPQSGFSDGAGGSNGLAMLNNPLSMVASGNSLLIADTGNNAIRKYDFETNHVTTIAGNRSTFDNGDGLPATQASMYHPRGIVASSDGSIYISTERGYIRRIDSNGIIQTLAGKPREQGGILSDVTDMRDVALDSPTGMALDEKNNYLYVADTGHHRILRLNLETYEARVIAGNHTCVAGDTFEGKAALDVSLCRPERIALRENNELFILDEPNKRIRKVTFQFTEGGVLRYQPVVEDNSELLRNENGEFLLTQRDEKETLFNSAGNEIRTTDRIGRTSSYQYDGSGRLLKAQLPTGQAISLNYSGNLLDSITDSAGRSTSFEYSSGLLTKVTFPDASSRQFHYDHAGVLIEEVNQKNGRTIYGLNKWKRLEQVTMPDNSTLTIHDSISRTISNENTQDNPAQLLSYGTNLDSLKDIIEDADKVQTTFLRDENGYLQEVISSTGKITKVERDHKGRPVKITKPDLTFVTLTYDHQTGDLVSKYDSLANATETYVYNPFGQLTSHTNYRGKTTAATYAPNGLVASETYSDGRVVSKSYNNYGLPLTVSNNLNQVTSMKYDMAGNIIEITSPGGESVKYERDLAGNIIKKISPKGEVSEYSYDFMNRLVAVKTPSGKITSYSYSTAGELLQITDPNQNYFSFNYDELGQVIKKVSPVGEVYEYGYDNNGNLVLEKDPSGQVRTYEYNAEKQLVQMNLPDDVYTYTYGENNTLTSVANNISSVQMDYINQYGDYLVQTVVSATQGIPTFTTTNIYDNNSNRVGLETDLGNYSYSYDSKDRLSGITNFKSESTSINYDQLNRIKKMSRSNLETAYEWNTNNFLTKILNSKDGSLIGSFIYNFDKNGNKTDVTTISGTSTFEYDSEGQLVAADQPDLLESFAYDNVFNRVQDQNGNFSYDSKKIRLQEDYRYIYAYDLRGNLVSKQDKNFAGKVWTYTYNSLSQLIQIKLYETTNLLKDINITYDVLGRRVKKEVVDFVAPQKSKVEKYVYDGNEILGIYDGDDELLARFTHSNLYTDDVLSVDVTFNGVMKGIATSAGTYHYIKDGLGSITEVTDSAGNIVQKYHYSSFGKILKVTDSLGSTLENPIVKTSFTYTGREYDEESEMYYYRARYFDPHSGRFISKDPFPGASSSPMTFNPYIYSVNNPTNRVDPSGTLSLRGLIQTAVYGVIFGGLGMLYDVNTSDNYTDSEVAMINTAVVIAAASYTGGAAGGVAKAATGSASIGAVAGGLAGGLVGGIGFVSLGIGSFMQGFIAGAMVGARAGYKAGAGNTSASSSYNYTTKLSPVTILCGAAAFYIAYVLFGDKIKNAIDKGLKENEQNFLEKNPESTDPIINQNQSSPSSQNSCQETAVA